MTGLRREKKLTEKTKDEIEKEASLEKSAFSDIKKTLAHIEEELQEIRDHEKK
jgi:septation ring formation regulator EzrA